MKVLCVGCVCVATLECGDVLQVCMCMCVCMKCSDVKMKCVGVYEAMLRKLIIMALVLDWSALDECVDLASAQGRKGKDTRGQVDR